MTDKYYFARDRGGDDWNSDAYATREAAADAGCAEQREMNVLRAPVERIFVVHTGRGIPVTAARYFDAGRILEFVGDCAYDEAPEGADDYPDVSAEAKAELQQLLDAWVEKHKVQPTFFEIEDVEEHELAEED